MAWFGKRTARQKEIRRSKAERRAPLYKRVFAHAPPLHLLVLLVSGGLVAAIVDAGQDPLPLREGQFIDRAIHARVGFRRPAPARTEVMRAEARNRAPDYYELDTSLVADIRGRLVNIVTRAREFAGDPERLRSEAARSRVILDDAGLAALVRVAEQSDTSALQQDLDRVVASLVMQPLVETHSAARLRTATSVFLVDPERSTKRLVPTDELLFPGDPGGVDRVVIQAANAMAGFADLRASARDSLSAMLRSEDGRTFKPLYRYNVQLSTRAAQDAQEAIEPQFDDFPAGTPLATPGILTADAIRNLREEHEAYMDQVWGDAADADPARIAARTAHRNMRWARGLTAFFVVLGLGGYLVLVYPQSLGGVHRSLVTTAMLLLCLALGRLVHLLAPTDYLAIGVFALAVALLGITAVRGPAYAAAGLLAIAMTLAARQGVGFLITQVVVALVLLYGLRALRQRGRIIAVGTVAAASAGVLSLLTGLAGGQPLGFAFWHGALWATLTTLVAAFFVEGILPGIERAFGVTTDLTLLEWCDPNRPVLRLLAAESPGTYNHSLLVGTLAGAAADAIGANGLLARTGAYYHDIGKINKPEYFVENQVMGVGNRHERLSPAMSHLVIIGHVKDGIEMAKEYGIPPVLRSFIPEHHGTCVVEYFFHAASQARKPGDPEVSDAQFRYPGPKPRSRESAIVMVCDTVEGAVRSMSEPTPGRIEDTVERLIQKRMMDGQFDDCDLTFRELSIIRDSLVKSLSSIYHGRIRYPSADKDEDADGA